MADSAIPTASTMTSCTVVLLTWNSFEIARSLMPSLCFSRIAASRFSFSCTERARGDLGVGILAESAVFPRRLQVVLGSDARDTVIWRIPLFYSTSSGRPRAPPKGAVPFRGRPRDPFRFLPKGHFPEPEGGTSGYSIFPDSAFLEYRKDGPRVTDGFAPRTFSPLTKADLGGVQKPLGRLATPPDPLPDFPVHRGHRISTYRLPIDNSLSFPCLDGQC